MSGLSLGFPFDINLHLSTRGRHTVLVTVSVSVRLSIQVPFRGLRLMMMVVVVVMDFQIFTLSVCLYSAFWMSFWVRANESLPVDLFVQTASERMIRW